MAIGRRVAQAISARVPIRSLSVTQHAVAEVLREFRAEDDEHPERLAVLPHAIGQCLEIGCGPRKTLPSTTAIDLSPGGTYGKAGSAAGRLSTADVGGDGAALPFRAEAFDSIIARHNLEHYVDTLAVLSEWKRVLRPNGTIAVIVPDEERFPARTVELDPTHMHAFSEASLRRLFEAADFQVNESLPVVDRWSFLLVATKASNGDQLSAQ